MAERRMFAKTVIDSDAFLDMSTSAQLLYFHLAMRADDDGFVNNPKKIQRVVGVNDDDLKLLIAKRFILVFDSGIIVIKHWKLHNYIQKDRYKPTVYVDEKHQITEDENKVYTECIQNVYSMDTQDRLGKDRLGKDRLDMYCPAEAEKSEKETESDNVVCEVIDYLNKQAGTKYKPTTKATKQHINARVQEGYTLGDFKAVIDKKVAVWKNTEWEQYIRPQTLFGAKFESYLNAPVKQTKVGASGVETLTDRLDDLDCVF